MTDHENTAPQPEHDPAPSGGDALDPKIGALLSYLLFMWIGGLIMFLTQKHPEVRFHAAQSILTSIALFVLGIGLMILSLVFAFVPLLGALVGFLLSVGLSIGSLVLWIVLCIKGYNLEHFKLPFVGDIAERWAAGQRA